MKILIFGGTGEARELATELVALGHEVTTSLAGRTITPLKPAGDMRVGGFGGVDSLREYFTAEGFDWVIDATHPYAAAMSTQLVEAVRPGPVKFLRLLRPAWEDTEWTDVPDISAAIDGLPDGARVLVTTGHKGLDVLATRADCQFFVRLIERPEVPPAANATIIIERPPYDVHGELSLMREYGITHLLTKNAGGDQTRAKIDAAAQLGVTILMVRRPDLPAVDNEVASVDAALDVLQEAGS